MKVVEIINNDIQDKYDASWKENTDLSMTTFEDLSTYLEG
jgi:hypothetical protein